MPESLNFFDLVFIGISAGMLLGYGGMIGVDLYRYQQRLAKNFGSWLVVIGTVHYQKNQNGKKNNADE